MGKNDKNETSIPAIQTMALPAEFEPRYSALMKALESMIAPRLPQISILHQAEMFEMPDETKVDEFVGIILDSNSVNAYWIESFDDTGGGVPPDCWSMNAIDPGPEVESPGSDLCARCDKNKFKSDGGRGKACKNIKRVHIILPDQFLPFRLPLPPTSLSVFETFSYMMVSGGLESFDAVVRFSLVEDKNNDGIAYSKIKLSRIGLVGAGDRVLLGRLSVDLKGIMRGQLVVSEEYGG